MTLPSYFRLARKAAKLSDHWQYKIGSVILINGKPVSVGYNLHKKTHTLTKQFNSEQTIHAEVSSIISVKNKENLKNAVMVTFRETRDGRLAKSRPCRICQEIMKHFGFKEIIYTIDNGYARERFR